MKVDGYASMKSRIMNNWKALKTFMYAIVFTSTYFCRIMNNWKALKTFMYAIVFTSTNFCYTIKGWVGGNILHM